jgi:ABC-type transport system substrate-binding protein
MHRTGRTAISTTAAAIIVVILILAVAAGIYFYSTQTKSTTSSTTSSSNTTTSSSSTSSTSTAVPSTLTYEAAETAQYLDPAVSYYSYDYNVLQNVYEPLLWYNASCSTCVIPWLAQSYTVNTAGSQYSFTLRSGITFQDGEQFNSSVVWFTLNRALIDDGSTPVGHGTQSGWLVQQLSNQSLSSFFSGAQTYGKAYVDSWLAQDFVQATGQYTFNLNVENPNVAVPYLLANPIDFQVAPTFIEQHDLALWTASSAGYNLPYTTLSGNFTQKAIEYFQDLSATCNAGITPSGCGATYLDTATSGSTAGTGPYSITSNALSTNTITLQANPTYWGGPYQYASPAGAKIDPQIKTVVFKYVADQTTREIDLQNAAKSGQAMAVDVGGTNLYDVAAKSSWLATGTLVSTLPGVSLYGPYGFLSTLFDPFDTNVSSPLTGSYYAWQPFADQRIRLAFADAVNMTAELIANNDNLGSVALNVVPPGLPPAGAYNSSIKPIYSYNPDASAQLLIQAMQHPIKSFNFVNGTKAPAGLFNNTFGCATFNANGVCSNPVAQSVPLVYGSGDTPDEAIFNDLAGVINNISTTYNMGLTVVVEPLPTGQLLTEAFSEPTHLYMYALGWIDDYPWVLDFTGNMLSYPGTYPGASGMNFPAITALFQASLKASASGNTAALVSDSDQMNALSNQEVMYLWTFYAVNFVTMTSNVQGLYWNTGLGSAAGNGVGPEYFASLY